MRTTADTETHSAPPFTPSVRGMPRSQPQRRTASTEVPEEDMDRDIEGPDGDPMEDFGKTLPCRAASPCRRYCEDEEHRSSTQCHFRK